MCPIQVHESTKFGRRRERAREAPPGGKAAALATRPASARKTSSRQLELLKWEVTFDAAYGLDASFLCRGIAAFRWVTGPDWLGGTGPGSEEVRRR